MFGFNSPAGFARDAWQRYLRSRVALLTAAIVFASGGAVSVYYATQVDSGPVGAAIVSPRDGATLTDSDDATGCADGFQTDVVVKTNAPDGTTAYLTANGLKVADGAVSGGQVVFHSVQLGGWEKHALVAMVAGARAVSTVTVHCAGQIECRLLGPTWSPERPRLNGTRRRDSDAGLTEAGALDDPGAVMTGDKGSSEGASYQFRVSGLALLPRSSPVGVYLDGVLTGTAQAPGGDVLQIDGVPLPPTGVHELALKCTDASTGAVGWSSASLFEVDEEPPQLAVIRPSAGGSATGMIRVCASTTAKDAIDQGQLVGANLCAGLGASGASSCAQMVSGGALPAFDGGAPEASIGPCDGGASCNCPARSACDPHSTGQVNPLTGCSDCWISSPCPDGWDGGYDPLSQVSVCFAGDGDASVGAAFGWGCPVGTSPAADDASPGDQRFYFTCTDDAGAPHVRGCYTNYVGSNLGVCRTCAAWEVTDGGWTARCVASSTYYPVPTFVSTLDAGVRQSIITYSDGGTAAISRNLWATSCDQRPGCRGCPAGGGVVGSGPEYRCTDLDGSTVSQGSVPCAAGAQVTWDGGAYACDAGGDVQIGAVPRYDIALDGGCSSCAYPDAGSDGETITAPWQCQQCPDLTPTPNGACVDLACAPGTWDVRVALYDGTGNVTTRTLSGVRCAGAGPSLEVADPPGGSLREIQGDLGRRVLASTTTTAPHRDSDPVTPGAQYQVRVCTNAAIGSTVTLLGGRAGTTLSALGTGTVGTGDTTGCSYGRSNVALVDATLPESGEDPMGRLVQPTRLQASVTEGGGTYMSPPVDLWVDTIVPALSADDLCGTTADAGTRPLTIRSSAVPVIVTVTNPDGTQSYWGISQEGL